MVRPIRFGVSATLPRPVTEWRELARRAESLGFSSLCMPDHLETQMAPLVALTVAAEATETLRLTTLVLGNDYRHPAFLAQEAATLDLLSDGRLELGLGAGWMTSDYDRTGIRLDRPGLRIERLAETIEVLRGCFGDIPFDFNGEHYRIRNLDGEPKPVQRPHPPLLVAGGGQRILGLAAQAADIVGLNPNLSAGVIDRRTGPSSTPSATDEKLDWIRSAAGNRFDHLELQTRVHIATVTDNPKGVAETMAPALGITVEDALASPHLLAGSVGQCVERALVWRERWGITYITISEDAMEAIAPVAQVLVGA